MNENTLDAAQVGKMFVVKVLFEYHEKSTSYDSRTGKDNLVPAHWDIRATLNDKPQQYGSTQTMTVQVEHGIGQKLVEVLLPVIIADASKKAQQLADDSKAMLEVLGDRTIKCITDMPAEQSKQ